MNVKAIPLYLSSDEILSLYCFLDDFMNDYCSDRSIDEAWILVIGQSAFAEDTYCKILYGVDEITTKVL